MEKKGYLYSGLKRGDIISAMGQIGVVIDALRSSETENMCLYIAFVHNIGNSRQYDMLELTPTRATAIGADRWQLATPADLAAAIEKRRQAIEKSIQSILSVSSA